MEILDNTHTVPTSHWGAGEKKEQSGRAPAPEETQVSAAEDGSTAAICTTSVIWEPLEILARSGDGSPTKAVFALLENWPMPEGAPPEKVRQPPAGQTWSNVSHLAPEGLAPRDIRPGNLVHGAELLGLAGAVLAAFWNCEPGDALVVFGCGTVVLDRFRGSPSAFGGFAEPGSTFSLPACAAGGPREVARILCEAQFRWKAQLEYFREEPRVLRAINHALGILSKIGYSRDAEAKVAALWTGKDGTSDISFVLSAVECACFTPDVVVFAPYALTVPPESLSSDAAEKILGGIASRARDLYRRDLLGPAVVGLYVYAEPEPARR